MITILIVSILILSIFCSLVLGKQHIAVLLVVLASGQMSAQSHYLICSILFTVMLNFLYNFFSAKRNKFFLLISLLPVGYILAIFLIQPYKINIYHYLGYSVALLIFLWTALVEWTPEKIVKFLTVYGFCLISTGFIEKVVAGSERIGRSLTVATAYAVVLVIAWAIWLINAYLQKIYSLKAILLGTFLVFLAIIFSGTRMGLIGIFIGLALCGLSAVLMKNKNMNIIKIATYSVGIITLLLFLSITVWNLLPNDLYIKKTFSTLVEGKLDESNMGRVHIWIVSLHIIEENKLFGIGAGNFPEKCKASFASYLGINKKFGINTHAHNIYLIMLSEHGITGFLVLIAFAFFCMLKSFLYFLKNRDSPVFYALFAGFLIMAVLGLFDATPMYMPTAGFAAWFFGVCASFKKEEDIC